MAFTSLPPYFWVCVPRGSRPRSIIVIIIIIIIILDNNNNNNNNNNNILDNENRYKIVNWSI